MRVRMKMMMVLMMRMTMMMMMMALMVETATQRAKIEKSAKKWKISGDLWEPLGSLRGPPRTSGSPESLRKPPKISDEKSPKNRRRRRRPPPPRDLPSKIDENRRNIDEKIEIL